jgi:carboxyl-terminal processing protease
MSKAPQLFRNAILASLLVILGGVVGYRLRDGQNVPVVSALVNQVKLRNTSNPEDFKDVDFSQFWEVWRILEQKYLDPSKLDKKQMTFGAIKGMTAALEDPYTLYLPPTDQKRSEEDLQGSFYGVGIQLGYVENTLAVMTPIKGSPAEKAGVKAKDLILHVQDEKAGVDADTQGWTLQEAVDKIRGEKGTKVTLTLYRRENENSQPFKVTLERGEIIVPSVELSFVDKNNKHLAHIVLSRFGERTDTELNDAIQKILTSQPKVDGIILDMRNNPGGFLETAIDVASEFIKSGKVVTQQGKDRSQDFNATGKARLANYPVVVVVNGGSASASEIVTGALRDQLNAKIVGEKTFGKGTVQDAMKLNNGSGLHVTIARWLLPKGDWIHHEGIPVTVEVKDDPKTPDKDEVLEKAEEQF